MVLGYEPLSLTCADNSVISTAGGAMELVYHTKQTTIYELKRKKCKRHFTLKYNFKTLIHLLIDTKSESDKQKWKRTVGHLYF